MIKNAALYIFRKRKKSLILITIFSVILACIFACMRLLSTTSTVQQQLKQTTTSSFEFRKKDGTSFSFNQVEEIKKVADNESLEKHYQTIAKLENYSVVTGEEKIQRDDIDEEMKLEELLKWQDYTTKDFSYKYIEGKHMFVNTSSESLIKAIKEFVGSDEDI